MNVTATTKYTKEKEGRKLPIKKAYCNHAAFLNFELSKLAITNWWISITTFLWRNPSPVGGNCLLRCYQTSQQYSTSTDLNYAPKITTPINQNKHIVDPFFPEHRQVEPPWLRPRIIIRPTRYFWRCLFIEILGRLTRPFLVDLLLLQDASSRDPSSLFPPFSSWYDLTSFLLGHKGLSASMGPWSSQLAGEFLEQDELGISWQHK